MEVGSAGVADEQRVAAQDEPRVIATGAIRYEVRVVGEGVAGSRDGPQLGVAELDGVAVVQRLVIELDGGAGRQIGGGTGARDERGKPETWSACRWVSTTATMRAPWLSASEM